MALRKTVAAKTLDLFETVSGKIRRITACDHVADHLVFELADGADIAERCHRTAQAVGLLGRELRGIDSDPHCLLPKKGHPEGLVTHTEKLVLVAMPG